MTEQLTEAQQAAVEHFEGPLMVLAGPGSGKTRVITHRIARLLQRGVRPDEILAMTFTNKAAREMAERVDRLLGGVRINVSTFHRFCSRLLRCYPQEVGLQNNFTILDSSDQTQLVKRIMQDIGLSSSAHDPQRVLNRISRCRNHLVTPEQFERQHEERPGDPVDTVVYHVFRLYEEALLAQNSVDFDALLLHVVHMLSANDPLREFLDTQFRFILVDEYQDTNLAQYQIVAALSQQFPNLCTTGDPDQSIYGWRGARPENLVQFEQDFPGTTIVSLDQNFRSTGAIVRCADRLISHNPRRHRNRLTTDNPEGDPVRIRVYENAEAEADGIAAEIARRVREEGHRYSDFAVFYRINALSRPVETALSRHEIPFQVAAGFSFYERAEIRDLLGYLRLIENPADDIAFLRIVNRPARGIGDRTVAQLRDFATKEGISLLKACERSRSVPGLSSRSHKPLKSFVDLIHRLHEEAAGGHVAELIQKLIAEINYLALWKDENDEVDQDRQANVHELVNAARIYETAHDTPDNSPSLQGFLELATLTSEADSIDNTKGAVTLMTMHAAKGLEFPVVFIVGVESGLVPHERAVRNGDPASFQEERRLLYVGITRAMRELNLTQTRIRDFRGLRRSTISSPFLSEIEADFVNEDESEFQWRSSESSVNQHFLKAKRRYEAAQQMPRRPLILSAADLERRLTEMSGAGSSDSDNGATESPADKTLAANSDNSAETDDDPITDDSRHVVRSVMDSVARLSDSTEAEATERFSPGMKVRHPRFGRGIVVAASGSSSRATVTVLFEIDDREETFVADRCPLQPLGPQP
ncbi:MAG: UvrD-helicase domain-containing protein [Planctomycetaceae bacterium]|nr:UvrD-helicase domain-containing protein [Planctomycetaceae bacterium]